MERNRYAELCGDVCLRLLPVPHSRKLRSARSPVLQHPPVFAERLQQEHGGVGAVCTHEVAVNSED